jgi:hypothetical protein
MKKKISYGVGDFKMLRKENMYYIDKTKIIEELEKYQYPFLIRPRRFGKSLLISTLENYYDVEKKEMFDELFEGLYIQDHKTSEANSYCVLRIDFTGIESSFGKETLYGSFLSKVKNALISFSLKYSQYFNYDLISEVKLANDPANILDTVNAVVKNSPYKIYLLIDEYDNFANDLISADKDDLYYEILSKTGFVRTFYETLKSGAQEGAISRIFMTGVSPIMLDDMTSGFNIAKNITLDKRFSTMLGFTQDEVEQMIDYYNVESDSMKKKALKDMKTFYNGYLFNENSKERVYNPDMVLHFMDAFQYGEYPREMMDMNIKTDYESFLRKAFGVSKRNVHSNLQRLLKESNKNPNEITTFEEINEKDEIITKLKSMFPLEAISGKDEIISLMYYMGMLTIDSPIGAAVKLRVPNLVTKELHWEYLYSTINKHLNNTLELEEIITTLQYLADTGNPEKFVTYTYDKVLKYISNRDLIGLEEKHMKMIFLSFLSINNVYIPYSEIELNHGYSDIILYPDSRYSVKNSQIWELKYVKKDEMPDKKINEAKEQLKRYEQDEKFIRLASDTKLFKYIIVGTFNGVEIIEVE